MLILTLHFWTHATSIFFPNELIESRKAIQRKQHAITFKLFRLLTIKTNILNMKLLFSITFPSFNEIHSLQNNNLGGRSLWIRFLKQSNFISPTRLVNMCLFLVLFNHAASISPRVHADAMCVSVETCVCEFGYILCPCVCAWPTCANTTGKRINNHNLAITSKQNTYYTHSYVV